HAEREPLLINYLIVLACRAQAIQSANAILRAGAVADALRAELDKELTRSEDVRGFQQALKGERAYAISAIEEMRRGCSTCSVGGTGACSDSSFNLSWFNRAFFNTQQCRIVDGLEEQIALATQPYEAVKASEAKLRLEGPSLFATQLPAVLK